MSKYIIKNCPATGAGCCGDTCPGITDCPLKQIVELCKEELKGQYSDTWSLIQKISKLLDIEECE